MPLEFDVVIIGGGHAGAEAAWACARLGLRACLVSLSRGAIARMSCNPAIGGIGKGQLVREIDALGGLMGLAADATGIQFRMLNLSKGPAVWGPRCQSDRHAYAAYVQQALGSLENLSIMQGQATDILARQGRVAGVRVLGGDVGQEQTGGEVELPCRAAIVTAGTFLRGLMHCGQKTWPGGRFDEPATDRLSSSLQSIGIRLERLKTGTCPRIAAESIDYSRCARQDGDDPPRPFSFMNDRLKVDQIPCHLTATNPAVHDIIRENLHRAPMFTGQITAVGPRYCPSVETKIQRFPDRDSHLLFLEPEGRQTNWVYVNGLSTSLPQDVQEAMVHAIAGLEQARILRYGYAIEYDFAQPTQLGADLQAKAVGGLYLAGQVNGTTGYEEAAAQGLMAGINAALALRAQEPLILRRDQAYIGVMIDDLVTRGVLEPYRMFTSRAEHRLLLRYDNADLRLTPLGRQVGLVDQGRWERHLAKQQAASRCKELLETVWLGGKRLYDCLASPNVKLPELLEQAAAQSKSAKNDDAMSELRSLLARQASAVESVAVDCRYGGYIARQQASAQRLAGYEARRIPAEVDYQRVPHLRAEARERLSAIRPVSLGQAMRISGITPADITILMIHLAGGTGL
jgi:tRNA uridine 5-carboxymethylaminomethyl modification enzyme